MANNQDISRVASQEQCEEDNPGGWKIMRKRTDKNANPRVIADKIWKTIFGDDIR